MISHDTQENMVYNIQIQYWAGFMLCLYQLQGGPIVNFSDSVSNTIVIGH